MALIRLDKYIADSGTASRKEARDLVKAGRIKVNGAIASAADMKIDAASAEILLDGERLDHSENRYIMLNKPNGVVSATEDTNEKTVIDLLPENLRRQGLFPVGRLDKDTTGLLLLTNDGAFSHSVISPKRHVSKLYRAAVTGVLDEQDIKAFENGLTLGDGTRCMSAKLEIIRSSVGHVTIYEGKYHQVKRMFASRGKYVTALHRLAIGSLELDESLAPGEYRDLTPEEKEKIFK